MPSRKFPIFAIMLLLGVLTPLLAGRVPEGWSELANCRRSEGNFVATVRWDGALGIRFIVRPEDGGPCLRVEFSRRGLAVSRLPEVGFQTETLPVRQFPGFLFPEVKPAVTVAIKFREDNWSFYVDGRFCASLPAPCQPPARIYFPDDVRHYLSGRATFLPIPRVAYSTDFMIEEGATNQLHPWSRQTGSWRIHTALDEALTRPETNLARTQQAPLTADKSPNFYSLKGGGKEAVITTGYEFFDNYHYTGAIHYEKGEAGLVFLYQAAPGTANGEENPDLAEYYALTVKSPAAPGELSEVRLWQKTGGRRTLLRRGALKLYDKEWYQLGVKAVDDMIICYLDSSELFRHQASLPIGGRIGFFADALEELRFDDVQLRSINHTPLDTLADIQPRLLYHSGGFFRRRGWFLPGTAADSPVLPARAQKQSETLIVGQPHALNQVFAATVTPSSRHWGVGLIAGFRDRRSPHYHLTLKRLGEHELMRLFRCTPGSGVELLDQAELPFAGNTFRLTADASTPGRLRFLRDGLLITQATYDGDLHGGAGLWLEKGSSADFSALALSRELAIEKEKEQKNPVFQADDFMRHWASPEGQWVAGAADMLWHKGDFFSDFALRLPCIPGSEVHGAIPDDAVSGGLAIQVTENAMRLTVRENGREPWQAEAPLTAAAGQKIAQQHYTLRHEGYLLWIEIEGKTVLSHRLQAPLRHIGTRFAVKGLGVTDLTRSKVTRSNVLDEFFNESPHAWISAGGDWQIINRFQCTPSWSHMIGEAPSGLGAFWRKQIFSGDMTLEFYAGTRHGFYDEAGNLNCTLMAATTSPSSGYTFNCTEWDQNLSQNWTRLYRNGEQLAESNLYLVPRKRKGMYRRVLNPLVAAGRPIHGAWFYIKVRKIGRKIECYFDDEKIFTCNDDEPLQEGLVGIWTFVHSMTLAQIKITYDQVRPRPVPITMLPLPAETVDAATPTADAPAAADEMDAMAGVTLNGLPPDLLAPTLWQADDKVGRSTVTAFRTRGSDALLYRNHLGGGMMALLSRLPATDLTRLAGWTMQLKRTPGARFNLFYQTGNADAKLQLSARRGFYEHISGPDVSDGDWEKSGETRLPGQPELAADGQNWQPVQVWIPSRLRLNDHADSGKAVALRGLGLEQLDFMASGMAGNAPGDAYAISHLQPVFYGVPDITLPAGTTLAARYPGNPKFWGDKLDAAALQQRLTGEARPGLNRVILQFRRGGASHERELQWITLPDRPELAVGWATGQPERILVTMTAGYPDPRLARLTAKLADGTALEPERGNQEAVTLPLPRQRDWKNEREQGTLTLILNFGAQDETHTLPWPGPDLASRPVLADLGGLTPFFWNFETAAAVETFRKNGEGRYDVFSADPGQGQVLQVRNRREGQRLTVTFPLPLSLAQYPIFQSRYRAGDMSHVSLVFNNGHQVRLSAEDSENARAVRLAHDLRQDNTWATWLGIVSDALVRPEFQTQRFKPGGFALRSGANVDQTGRYSKIAWDDLVFGPAVSRAEQLACTPVYTSPAGIATLFHAIVAGAKPYADLNAEELAALVWHEAAPGTPITPAIDTLADGMAHFLLKARDPYGRDSQVTDIPVLLDRQPMTLSHRFIASRNHLHNGTALQIDVTTGDGAPWALEETLFQTAGKNLTVPAWSNSHAHTPGKTVVVLNYPFIVRNQLNAAKDGDTFDVTLSNLADGAGNPAPPLAIPVKVDYAADKTGPAWYSLAFTSGLASFMNWDGVRSVAREFVPFANNATSVVTPFGESPYLVNASYRQNGQMHYELSWDPNIHPALSFRLKMAKLRENFRLHVLLQTRDDKEYTLSLTTPRKVPTELNRSRHFTWKENTWQRFSFDIRQLLLDTGLEADKVAEIRFKTITFRLVRCEHQDTLALDDFFVHGLPDKPENDRLKWIAFDASGVEALHMTAIDDQEAELWSHTYPLAAEADLSLIRQKVKGIQWFRCAAKDKAGNLSVPFWMPLYNAP